MKITGTSSYMLVEYDNKMVKIQGEMMVGRFLAYSDSIKSWEPPHDHTVIDDLTKAKIIDAVIEKTKKSKVIIEFE
jgi:uncharacterized protein